MKKFNEFRESAADDAEDIRAKAERRAAKKQKQVAKMAAEEAVPVAKTSKEKPTAAHPQEPSTEGDTSPPKQGDSEDPKLTHNCATKVVHPKFGEGKPIMGEHAEPDANGTVWWYKVMFEHGIETCENYSMEVLEEGSHGNHKKKGY
tara:strand:- start:2830 stop:3270 length:441 start_codon:yes stop_codon:yes gene_type:complete